MALIDQRDNSDYSWLRDPNWPDSIDTKIIEYLNTENAKCDSFFGPIQNDVDVLFKELKGRIKEDDITAPVIRDNYQYYRYIEKGQHYWVHARKHGDVIEVLLDENKESNGLEFYKVAQVETSPDHKLLAYSVDINGSERYQVFIKDLTIDKIIDNSVTDIFGEIVWHENSKGFFYVPTGEHWRAEKVYYHETGTKASQDHLIYEEQNKSFWINPHISSSKEYLFITTKSGNKNEVWYLNLKNPQAKLTLIFERKDEHLYSVTHHGDYFYIITNDQGKNGRLVKAHIQNPSQNWEEIIAHNSDVYLLDATAYKNHIVIEKRVLGLTKIDVLHTQNFTVSEIKFKDEVYSADHVFTTFDSKALRFEYSSLIQPCSVIDWCFFTQTQNVIKVQEIPSGYDASQYETKRIWADSGDVKVPISLLYRKDIRTPAPLYLYGYGSYGISIPASFRSTALSLVDRGFVFAIAHVRGGDDLGYKWYESAKFLTKKRTFDDFINSAKMLIKDGYTSEGQIAIAGGSAGGMLVGYCVNNAPELYKAAVLHVPFVDVLSTMLDDSLPLTPLEFEEWGNPKEPEYYDYIKSYSPTDNVKAQHYPHIFIRSGLNDPRVPYWEPAIFALKLNDNKLDSNLLLLKTNMAAGHQGKSGRYDLLKEISEEYVFLLRAYGKL